VQSLQGVERALVAAAIFGALVWLAASWRGDASGALLAAKAAPAALLAAVAAGRSVAARDSLLPLALALHAAGDVLIELALLAGIVAFLAGHLVYVALFWPARREVDELGGATRLALGLLALVGALFVVLLAPVLEGASIVVVPAYVAGLLAMAACALVSRRGQPLLAAGGALFVVSDALLATDLFLGGVAGPSGRLLVWPLYVGAQLALALGWIRGGAAAPATR
jgi:uncharacterized membrane protein YhhN